jgi:hypothetical protein
MSTNVMNATDVVNPMIVSTQPDVEGLVRWTRQSDGSYVKEGCLPTSALTARVYAISEDWETNRNGVAPGSKPRPTGEIIALVERKTADGSYLEWRYEIRPEASNVETPPAVDATTSSGPQARLCKNERCRRGENGTRAIVKSKRALYCSASCRVAVSRRDGRPKPQEVDRPTRKRRSDAQHKSHAERQRAYELRARQKKSPTS